MVAADEGPSPCVRIGGAGGFWGDRVEAPIDLLREEPIDYLMLDYLAELTMSIMAKQRARDPDAGWATDLADWLRVGGLAALHERGVRLVTNAGGANPSACAAAVLDIAAGIGWEDCRVAVISGDDVLPRVEEFVDAGETFAHFETGAPLAECARPLLSANAYLGAGPIGAALGAGADVVITGRVADPSLLVGCMLHAAGWVENANSLSLDRSVPIYGWAPNSVEAPLDVLAQWTIAGHLIECGAQVCGGNSTDWESIDRLDELSLPIAEVTVDGAVTITRALYGGGRVDRRTVAEQLVYEISDPTAYATPDLVVDLSQVTLTEEEVDRVVVAGSRGEPRPDRMKVSAALEDGWFASGILMVPGPNAIARAEATDRTLRGRLDGTSLKITSEVIGGGVTIPPGVDPSWHIDDPSEVVLRWAAVGDDRDEVVRFTRGIAPLVLTGPGGVSGYSARARPRRQLRHWPTMLPREPIEQTVRCDVLGISDLSVARDRVRTAGRARRALRGSTIRLLGRLHDGLEHREWAKPIAKRIATRVPAVLQKEDGA